MKHSPGPWTVDEYTLCIVDADGYSVGYAQNNINPLQAKIDAELMALAPELYKYKKLLLAYMNHVGDIEGTVFLGRTADDGIKGLSFDEVALLRELSKGKTKPCPLCKYDYGHMIGCENNPVDIALKKS